MKWTVADASLLFFQQWGWGGVASCIFFDFHDFVLCWRRASVIVVPFCAGAGGTNIYYFIALKTVLLSKNVRFPDNLKHGVLARKITGVLIIHLRLLFSNYSFLNNCYFSRKLWFPC